MKKNNNLCLIFLVVLITSTVLISCEKKEVTPKESTKIFLDTILKDDKTKMSRIGIDKESFAKLKKDEEDNIMKSFGLQEFDDSIVKDEVKNKLKENMFKSISKLDYKETSETIDAETAKVIIEIKSFDMNKIISESQDKIKQKYADNSSMTQKDILQEYYKILGDIIEDSPIKEQPSIIEITLKKKDNNWQPDENAELVILNSVVSK